MYITELPPHCYDKTISGKMSVPHLYSCQRLYITQYHYECFSGRRTPPANHSDYSGPKPPLPDAKTKKQ